MMNFLKDFDKRVKKLPVSTVMTPPQYWTGIGNYAINRIVSGSYKRAIPQGRITCLSGPSGSGKSYLLCNLLKTAQKEEEAFVLVIDSEHALDETFLERAGVDTSPNSFRYIEVETFDDVTAVFSAFVAAYNANPSVDSRGKPKRVIVALDSVDMLQSETESENFDKGVAKGDMGQRTKQIKQLLRGMVQRIKHIPFSVIVTHQVYLNQDITNGEGKFIVNNALRYSCSQIFVITALQLKTADKGITGVRMKLTNYKSRFVMKGASVEVEVPFEGGMDKFSGLCDRFIEDGILVRRGAWLTLSYDGFPEEKFYEKDFNDRLFEAAMNHPKMVAMEADIADKVKNLPEEEEIDDDENS